MFNDISFTAHEAPKDLSNRRTMELDNNKLHVEKRDPFGFWYVHFDKGQVPESLKGGFTSFAEAEKAIEVYLREKKREVKSVTK